MLKVPQRELTFLKKVTRPYNKHLLLVLFLSLLAALFEGLSVGMLVPLLSSFQGESNTAELPGFAKFVLTFFDGLSPQRQFIYAIGILVSGIALKNLMILCSIYIGYWVNSKVVASLQGKAFEMLMTVDIGYFHDIRTGELADKILDHTFKVWFVIQGTVKFFVYAITLIMLFLLMLLFSWELTLLSIFMGSGIAFIISRYSQHIFRMSSQATDFRQSLAAKLVENISGIQTIRQSTKEQQQTARFLELVNNYRIGVYRMFAGFSSISGISEGLGGIVVGVLVVVGVFYLQMGQAKLVTQLLPFIYLLSRTLPAAKEMNQGWGQIVGHWTFLSRVNQLLMKEDKPYTVDGTKEFPGLKRSITIQNLSFSYNPNDERVLKDINFTIPRGRTTAIVGTSGSGKTTLINLLLKFYAPQNGSILVDNTPLKEIKAQSLRRTIGVVSQDTFIFNDTVASNIAFGITGEISDAAIKAAALKAGAHDFISNLSEGYETILGDRGIKLSGGQRQRISIARAILKDPEILILDEATSSLDNQTEKKIHQAVMELSRDRTVIIIAHRLSTIKGADQIIVLKNGAVAEQGHESDLLKQQGEFFKIAQSIIEDKQ